MWIADGWKDYEVIDTSCGEKLSVGGLSSGEAGSAGYIWDTPKGE